MSEAHEPIDMTADVLDSRDIIARIEHLRASWAEATGENPDDFTLSEDDLRAGLDEDEAAELVALTAFADDMSDYLPDWQYGETLVSEDYFTEYAKDLAEDIGAYPLSRDLSWPLTHIDWDAAADSLKMDYTSADLNGNTYWGRS